MSQFNGTHQGPIQGEENRYLNHHGKASAQGVNLPPFVQVHHLPIEASLIILVLLPQHCHFRLYLLHLLHRHVALLGQGPEQDLQQDGDNDDIHSIVLRNLVGEIHEDKQHLGNGRKPSKFDDLLRLDVQFLEEIDNLWADIELVGIDGFSPPRE